MIAKIKSNMKRFKIVIGWLVIILTILVFARFIQKNPLVVDQLKATNLSTIISILLLYGLMTLLLAFIYRVMAIVCRVKIPAIENLLLTMYSSVINFFGPLQSGPGFRTAYLKKKHDVNIASYVGVSLLYYFCFGAFSGIFLVSGIFGWWLIPMAIAGVGLLYLMTPSILKLKFIKNKLPKILPLRSLILLAALSFVQVSLTAAIYHTELTSLHSGITIGQTIIYTGAANFALFVSLTPGALGFREAFLVFSQNLHHIDHATIVSANILDRGVYVIFLGILFIIILAFHGQAKFKSIKADKPTGQ